MSLRIDNSSAEIFHFCCVDHIRATNLSKIVLFSSSAFSWPDEFQLLHFEERLKRQHFRNFLLLAARMSFNVYDVLEMVILDRLASQGMLTVLHTTLTKRY